ncbi:MAG: lipid-A-disaccharide synthase [Elusimicrobiota bacterium]
MTRTVSRETPAPAAAKEARILIVAGDPSGDLYASLLIRELRRQSGARRRDLRLHAAGGSLTREALAESRHGAFHGDLASLGLVGIVEPARRIPTLLKLLRGLQTLMADARPDAVVCIDYYGFNRHVLAAAKRLGVPAYYFISPQVWATRPGRVARIKRWVERMLVIFPFEKDIYEDAGVPVTWVGHPLLDLLPDPKPRPRPERAGPGPLRLGLLPGSRPSEVRRHLPMFLRSAARIMKDFPRAQVAVFAAPQLSDAFYRRWLDRWRGPDGGRPRIVRESNYAERSRQDLVLTSSGTATLENALLGLPMVVVYKTSWPNYFLARALIRVRHVAMANILAGRRLVPELIQHKATPSRVADAALKMLEDPRRLESLRGDLLALRETLGGPGATRRAAGILLAEIGRRRGLRACGDATS